MASHPPAGCTLQGHAGAQAAPRKALGAHWPSAAGRYSHGWISATGGGAASLIAAAAILRLSISRPAVISLTESAGECEPRASEETGMIPRSADLVAPTEGGPASLRLLATDAGLPLDPLEWSCFTSCRATFQGGELADTQVLCEENKRFGQDKQVGRSRTGSGRAGATLLCDNGYVGAAAGYRALR